MHALPRGLYALCDDERKGGAVLAGGVRVLQLRLKGRGGRDALVAVRTVAAACRAAGCLCLVNDRPDWALLAGADGVHLGDEDLPPAEARRVLGSRALLGVTVRDVEGARRARDDGASYVGLGPIFETRTKHVTAPVVGLAGLAAAVSASPLPVVAIGGIGLRSIAQVAATGVHGAAVLSDLLEAADIAGQARRLQAEFERGAADAARERRR